MVRKNKIKFAFLYLIINICVGYETIYATTNNFSNNNLFTQTEIHEFIAKADSTNNQNHKELIENTKNSLISSLEAYKITGFSYGFNFNWACVYNNLNLEFLVHYKNDKGEKKEITFCTDVTSFGFQLDLSFKMNLIFFVGTDLNFFNTNKKINLGIGIDFKSKIIHLTYVPFQNAPGGMFILGIPLIPWTISEIVFMSGLKNVLFFETDKQNEINKIQEEITKLTNNLEDLSKGKPIEYSYQEIYDSGHQCTCSGTGWPSVAYKDYANKQISEKNNLLDIIKNKKITANFIFWNLLPGISLVTGGSLMPKTQIIPT